MIVEYAPHDGEGAEYHHRPRRIVELPPHNGVGGKQHRPPKIVESAPRSGVGVEKQCHHPAPTTVGVVALLIATRHREEHISWQVLGVEHSFFQPQLKVTKQSQCNDDDDADCNNDDDENNNTATMTHNNQQLQQ